MAERQEQTEVSWKRIQWKYTAVEIYSTALAIREMQIKPPSGYHYSPTRMGEAETIVTTPDAGEEAQNLDHSHSTPENRMVQPLWKDVGAFLEK